MMKNMAGKDPGFARLCAISVKIRFSRCAAARPDAWFGPLPPPALSVLALSLDCGFGSLIWLGGGSPPVPSAPRALPRDGRGRSYPSAKEVGHADCSVDRRQSRSRSRILPAICQGALTGDTGI